jgi:hypothetical protein
MNTRRRIWRSSHIAMTTSAWNWNILLQHMTVKILTFVLWFFVEPIISSLFFYCKMNSALLVISILQSTSIHLRVKNSSSSNFVDNFFFSFRYKRIYLDSEIVNLVIFFTLAASNLRRGLTRSTGHAGFLYVSAIL